MVFGVSYVPADKGERLADQFRDLRFLDVTEEVVEAFVVTGVDK